MDLFKNRNFVRLFFAAFASQMGTTVGNMAFAFFLLDRFSSQPDYTTIAELMYSLPTVFVFFIVGVVADRFDRKKVAENCDWIRAGLTVVLFFVLYLQIIPLVFLVLFIRSAVTKFFYPAEASLVQAILRKDQYAKAAGLNQMLFSLFLLFGVGIGAFMYKTIGLHGAIALDFVSFIVSGFLIRSCDIPLEARQPNGQKGWKNMTVKDSMHDFKEGIVYILKNKLLASLVFGYFIFGLVSGGLSVLPMFKMKYELSPDSYEWHTSLFTIVLGIGLLTGIAVAALLEKKVKPAYMMSVPIFIAGAFIILLGFTDQLPVYYSAAFLAGICIGPINTALGGWIPKIVHPRLMGRVSGWTDPLTMMAQSSALGVIAVLFPGIIADVDYIYYGLAGIILLAAMYYFIVLPKLSAENAEIDVQAALKRQKNTKAKMNSVL
ncbi:MFS transporter [Bacillus paralicheniformis]|uniref:MFS transporter n=1 Tax=Bacillus paralicheniformis TaxID=1648923 RepID=UPI00214E3A07|nr:MFS transporter [Bacillus paralicheniformis]MCR3889181.1 MFS transporter [Bacillus paralicheniformis]